MNVFGTLAAFKTEYDSSLNTFDKNGPYYPKKDKDLDKDLDKF
jgi:hypothetical protein